MRCAIFGVCPLCTLAVSRMERACLAETARALLFQVIKLRPAVVVGRSSLSERLTCIKDSLRSLVQMFMR